MPDGVSRHDDHLVDWLIEPATETSLAGRVRFNHSTDQWHVWTGMIWAPDMKRQVYEMIRHRALSLIDDAPQGDDRKAFLTMLDTGKKESLLKALSAREGIAMSGNEWDPDPEKMAFSNGVLNLRTGAFTTSPDPDWLMSRSTGYRYVSEEQVDQKAFAGFADFVRGIMGGDEALADYLCRVLGYSMIGWQREQKFWMFVGPGQNGKGVLTRTVAKALGSYASTPPDTLYMKTRQGAASSDKPRPELVRLNGVRFTYMSEPQGGQFNEEMLKAHSGNDAIEARNLYAGASMIVQFYPTHTIIFLTNNPPRTEDVGPSMQRRVKIIKFEQDYRDPARDDKGLEDRLKEDRSIEAILLMLTKYAKRYFEEGLPEPAKVTEWSDEYIEDNDPLAAFIGEGCVTGKGLRAPGALMWAAYQDWAARADVDVGSQTGFGLALGRRYAKEKTRTGTIYHGIRPKSAVELADE